MRPRDSPSDRARRPEGGVGKADDRHQSGHGARRRRRGAGDRLDPQGNASTGLGVDLKSREISTYDVLSARHFDDAIVATAVPRLSIAPSTLDLLGVELEIAGDKDRAFRLKKRALAEHVAGERHVNAHRYSYILIDCPPSLNLFDHQRAGRRRRGAGPLQCEFFALEGLSQLLLDRRAGQARPESKLSIHGIVLTMFDARNNLATQVVARRAPLHGRQGLRDDDPAQCADLRGALAWQTGAALRSQMQRQPGLFEAGVRGHSTRAKPRAA